MNHSLARLGFDRQTGQAMTEFLVVALAMLPLLFLIPLIAKYQDISHSTQMAARNVAFDGTIRNGAAPEGWKPEATLADEVRRRFFSNSGEVSRRIQGATSIFPAGALADVGDAMSAVVFSIEYLSKYGEPSGPKLGKLDIWQDVVPEDCLRSGNQ